MKQNEYIDEQQVSHEDEIGDFHLQQSHDTTTIVSVISRRNLAEQSMMAQDQTIKMNSNNHLSKNNVTRPTTASTSSKAIRNAYPKNIYNHYDDNNYNIQNLIDIQLSAIHETSSSSLSSSSSIITTTPTSTTTLIIIIIHLIFLYQWNIRKRRKDILVSYRIIVQKKQYYKLWLAVLSHPSSDNNNHRSNQGRTINRSRRRRRRRSRRGRENEISNQNFNINNTTSATGTDGTGTGNATTTANNNNSNNQHQQNHTNIIIVLLKRFIYWSYQSGFALMVFNCHILWSCRSLEALYNFEFTEQYQFQYPNHYQRYQHYNQNQHKNNNVATIVSDITNNNDNSQLQEEEISTSTTVLSAIHPCQYARVMFALTALAILIELRFSYTLLRISKRLSSSTSSTSTDSSSTTASLDLNDSITIPMNDDVNHDRNNRSGSSRNYSRIQQKILHRPIGTMTVLTTSIIFIFRDHFQYVPVQILPFIDNRWLLFGFSLPPTVTSILCYCILGYLSFPSHPISPIIFGLLSGFLWSSNIISFFQESYWGNTIFALYVLFSFLSIRAREYNNEYNYNNNTPTWIPCIDFVSWNRQGQFMMRSASSATTTTTPLGGGGSGGGGGGISTEDYRTSSIYSPVSSSSSEEDGSSSSSDNTDNDSSVDDLDVLYGRIPQFGESFDDDDASYNNNNSDNNNNYDVEMTSLLPDNNDRSSNQNTVRSRRGVSFG